MKKPTITRRIRLLALAGVAVIALPLAFGQLAPARSAAADAAPMPIPVSVQPSMASSYRAIVEADKPAVVTIITKSVEHLTSNQRFGQHMGPNTPFDQFFRQFFNERGIPLPDNNGPQERRIGGLGSGFIISPDGTIVTNNHVVAGAQDIKVVLDDGSEHPATLVGRDAKTDLAVIRIKVDKPLPYVAWGDSDKLEAGDPILAIGNPFGIGTTVTAGIVSARGRDLHNGPYDDFIQVDAAINHGNSGGPLIDMQGKVVGVNSAIYSPNGGNVGVGFAIPSDQAREIVTRLIEHGSIQHGFIGIMIQPVTKDVANAIGLPAAKGALVAEVNKDSPAMKAGLKPGDVVTAFGKTEITTPKSLSRAVADLEPGAKSKISVFRRGKSLDLSITVGKQENNQVAMNSDQNQGDQNAQPGSFDVKDLGVTLSDLTDQDRESANVPEETEGAMVAAVNDNSAASDDLRQGDIILSVNQEPVTGARNAGQLIEQVKKSGKRSVLLLVERGQAQSFVAVPFAQG